MEQEMPKNVFPLNMDGVEDIDFYLHLITQFQPDMVRRAQQIAFASDAFNLEHAAACGVYQQIRNIQNAQQQLCMHLAMAFFTAEQISGDVEQIRKAYKDAQRDYTRRLITEQDEAAKEERRKKERERIAEKRAAGKAELAQKKWQRPDNRFDK